MWVQIKPKEEARIMVKKIKLLFVLLSTLVFTCSGIAKAEEAVAGDNWQFTFSPYFWGVSMEGTSIVRNNQSDVDISFSDIWDNLNMAAMGDLRLEKGRWAIQSNILWAELEADKALGPLNINVEPTMWIVEVDGRFRLNDQWELLAGIRYYDFKVDFNITGALGVAVSGSEDWVDPVVGIVFSSPLSDRWTFAAAGDIGGFGVGSDFAFQLWGMFDYRFGKSKRHSFVFGWRHLDFDYDTGGGNRRFELDTYMTGPILGVRFRF
jgi:hypothetical protein